MTKRLVVTVGDDPLTLPILEYLERTYDIERENVRAVQLICRVGEPQIISLDLYVNIEPATENKIIVFDHAFDADDRYAPCEMLGTQGACGRFMTEHETSKWKEQ